MRKSDRSHVSSQLYMVLMTRTDDGDDDVDLSEFQISEIYDKMKSFLRKMREDIRGTISETVAL